MSIDLLTHGRLVATYRWFRGHAVPCLRHDLHFALGEVFDVRHLYEVSMIARCSVMGLVCTHGDDGMVMLVRVTNEAVFKDVYQTSERCFVQGWNSVNDCRWKILNQCCGNGNELQRNMSHGCLAITCCATTKLLRMHVMSQPYRPGL